MAFDHGNRLHYGSDALHLIVIEHWALQYCLPPANNGNFGKIRKGVSKLVDLLDLSRNLLYLLHLQYTSIGSHIVRIDNVSFRRYQLRHLNNAIIYRFKKPLVFRKLRFRFIECTS
jgi:hypothetical protein